MKRQICMTFVLALALSEMSSAAEIVSAGTIRVEKADYTKLRLSGPISVGDSAVIAQIAKTDDNYIVSLDSEGGAYYEGLKLAILFRNQKIQTIVERGSVCISACAIAFMGGALTGDEAIVFSARSISAGGQLGFHAPFLDIAEDRYDKNTVEAVFDSAVRTIVEFIAFAPSIDIDEKLAATLMAPQRKDILFINNVDQLGLFGIAMQGISPATGLTSSMVQNICINGWGWQSGEPSTPAAAQAAGVARDFDWDAGRSTFAADTDYYGPNLEVKRTVVPLLNAGEGGAYFCVVDRVANDIRLHINCRGYLYADGLPEAVEKASRIDRPETGQYGLVDVKCTIPWIVEPLKGYGASYRENAWALVPPATSVDAINDVLHYYAASEDPL